jgi:hypothetical protein
MEATPKQIKHDILRFLKSFIFESFDDFVKDLIESNIKNYLEWAGVNVTHVAANSYGRFLTVNVIYDNNQIYFYVNGE